VFTKRPGCGSLGVRSVAEAWSGWAAQGRSSTQISVLTSSAAPSSPGYPTADIGFHLCVPLGYPQSSFASTSRKPTLETTFLDRWDGRVLWM
jgi:hypothetical protein